MSRWIWTACAVSFALAAYGADERLAVELDAAITGFETARAAGENEDGKACAEAVKALNDRWGPFHKAYRDTATMDAKWKTDFDAVKAHIEMAAAMLSREEPLSAVAAELAKGKATLEALRTRNGIPVPESDLEGVIAALEALQASAEEWSRPGSEAPPAVTAALQDARAAWDAAKLGRAGGPLVTVVEETLARLEDAANSRRPLIFRNAAASGVEAIRRVAALRPAAN